MNFAYVRVSVRTSSTLKVLNISDTVSYFARAKGVWGYTIRQG